MITRSLRRATAWICAFALVASAALPMHAFAHATRGVPFGSDFCTTSADGKPAPGTLPASSAEHPCGDCCLCSGGAALPVQATSVPASVAITIVAPQRSAVHVYRATRGGDARAPPVLS